LDWRGRVRRTTYGLTLISSLLLLHNMFRLFASPVLRNRLESLSILFPLTLFYGAQPIPPDLMRTLPLFALVTVPFLWIAITMTVKRLRDLETTEWYVFLLFVPALNVLFFLLLCFEPGCESMEEARQRGCGFLETLLPRSPLGSAALGALAGALVATVLSWFSIVVLGSYGSTLFLALPFFMGYVAAWLHGYRQPRSPGECSVVALASILLTAALIVGIAFEGIICVAMAIPLAAPLALVGGHLAYLSQKSQALQPRPTTMLSLLLALPLLAGVESFRSAPVPHHVVHSSVEIAAPPRLVWQRIVAFPSIEEKPHWILRLGMAYPVESKTIGLGLSADRQTRFSTGVSREPILAWEEERHLAFRVSDEPPLMKESSPYGAITVRHLEDHDFRSGRVDFYLSTLPNGHTQLDGWSSYENRMWPTEYWQLWTDEIVRQIQLRVFRQVKRLAEADATGGKLLPGSYFRNEPTVRGCGKTSRKPKNFPSKQSSLPALSVVRGGTRLDCCFTVDTLFALSHFTQNGIMSLTANWKFFRIALRTLHDGKKRFAEPPV
jgi:uncharacterized membrane protein YhaH (DUF805 family)